MRILRYFLVGAVAATVDIGVFGLLVKLCELPWFPVAVLSFLLATGVNYLLSVRHVFESGVRFGRHNEIFLVFLVSAIGLCLSQAVLWVLIELLLYGVLLAKVCATGIVFFWNYGSRRYFVFRTSASRQHTLP